MITIDLKESSTVNFRLCSLDGKEIRTLYSGYHDAGMFTFRDSVRGLTPGVYFYRVNSESRTGAVKLLVVR